MDISRIEQRILHLLAQGGRIGIEKNEKKRIASVKCLTRDGWHYPGVDLDLFRKLKRKKAVSSSPHHKARARTRPFRTRQQIESKFRRSVLRPAVSTTAQAVAI
jgi:uncharacterized protein YjhX (UPF0386 family)